MVTYAPMIQVEGLKKSFGRASFAARYRKT